MAEKDADLTLKLDFSRIQQRSGRRFQVTCNLFEIYGRFVGKYPWPCLFMTLLFLWPAVGTVWMNVKDNIRDGYTPMDAPSRTEALALRNFYNTSGEPRMSVVLVSAKDKGSLLRLNHLAETVTLGKHLMNTFEVKLEDGKPFFYNDLCEPYCNLNRPLEVFYVSQFPIFYTNN
jgi:hypothetical protein